MTNSIFSHVMLTSFFALSASFKQFLGVGFPLSKSAVTPLFKLVFMLVLETINVCAS